MSKFTEICDNLLQKAGISANKMMKDLGFSSGLYYQWKKDLQNPSPTKLAAIAKYLDISVDTLMGVEHERTVEIISDQIYNIPVYESVSAGLGVYANDRIVGFLPVTVKKTDVQNTFAAKVVGNSMYPQICDGDTIIVRKNADVENGDIAVILIDSDEAVVKKVKFSADKLTLISFNPEYEDRVFTAEECEERVKIMGKVIGSYKSW